MKLMLVNFDYRLAKLAPARGRGLKLGGTYNNNGSGKLAPARGRGLKLVASVKHNRSRRLAPARGRGLKHYRTLHVVHTV